MVISLRKCGMSSNNMSYTVALGILFGLSFLNVMSSVSSGGLLKSLCYQEAEQISGITIADPLSIPKHHVFPGKAVLIVNTASFCTYTSQYLDFNELQDEFGDDLLILAFPCNQFGQQEPGVDVEILNSLRYVRPGGGYLPNFNVTRKVEVNGPDALPLFDQLKTSCPPVKMEIGDPQARYWSPFQIGDITWNFNKFLLNKDGVPFMRYDSSVEPLDIRADIISVLSGLDFLLERPHRPKYIPQD